MLNATPEVQAESWDAVYETVQSTQIAMLQIADCLRAERECVTLFDAPRLLKVLASREAAVADFESGRVPRRRALEQAWTSCELPGHLPDDMATALRGFTEGAGADRARLRDAASELEVLADVIRELHEMNRGLLEQAMTWVNMYVADLMGTARGGTYDGAGRMRAAGGSVLRRTI